MPELCIDLGLVLGTYVAIAAVMMWVVVAIIRSGYVDDHSEPDYSKPHYSESEGVIR